MFFSLKTLLQRGSMIIDGKKVALDIQMQIQSFIATHCERAPCLAVLVVGNHPPSQIYVSRKTLGCQSVGIKSIKIELSEDISEQLLLEKILELNTDPQVDGILVQLPLPAHINPNTMMEAIDPAKDVDGLHPYNVGKMLLGDTDGFFSCTPLGIKTLMQRSKIELTGKHVLVIGRSNIVGKPTAALLMQSTPGGNATVTIAHRHTQNLQGLCQNADIIIAATGQPRLITANMVKEGAVVIDVGTNKVIDSTKKAGYRIVGDVDFENVAPKCSFITPVPGGVGPMTIAMLLHNTLHSYEKKFHSFRSNIL